MIKNRKIEVLISKGKSGGIRDWMSRHHISDGLLLFIPGILSTIWFLVRVIPKPSRASYPCMRVAAPFMSGFILYLLSVFGLTLASGKTKRKFINVRFLSAFILTFGVLVTIAVNPTGSTKSWEGNITWKTGPDDGPNQPFGNAMGVKPGRVVWVWDTLTTNRDCKDYFFKPENTRQGEVSRMFDESVLKLTGESSVSRSWDAMFRYFNSKKHHIDRGYTPGEKIFIKINQTSGRGRLSQAERDKGNYYYPPSKAGKPGHVKEPDLGTCETGPDIVLQILRQLINECGVKQQDIAVGDPQNPTYGHNFDAWSAEFPDVVYTDRSSEKYGRTLIHPTKYDLVFYSDKFQTDKLYDIIENAEYLINVANLKPHSGTGITLTGKNHFGSQSRAGAYHLHYSHLCQIEGKPPTNAGYHKYRVLVDLMGSRYLGKNTILYVIDGLYAGGASEGGPPVRYYMPPFNGNWCSSIFISEDQVALESVCYDFLRTEWNGTYSHDPSNNSFETLPNINGVDDYLHQAADSLNWPEGIKYDPDNSGKPISSLGVHEHWNNPVNKQYSRNLDRPYGIELVAIPAILVGPRAPEMIPGNSGVISREEAAPDAPAKLPRSSSGELAASPVRPVAITRRGPGINSVIKRPFSEGFSAKKFFAGVLDDNNGKWFLTDAGIVRGDLFSITDRMDFSVVSKNFPTLFGADQKILSGDLKNFVYELSEQGPEFWIATSRGAIVASMPQYSDITDASIYRTSNSDILNNEVISVALGRNQLRWFGTGSGISALYDNKWLKPAYREVYPENLFKYYPITAMATSVDGDSLYVGTEGAGVSRVFRDSTDAISGASQYLPWGPIEMPSDTVLSICITRDGTQWIGTNRGVARHTGYRTLENWTVFDNRNGLVDNHVQAVAAEPYGKNVWFGTKGGLSVFDGTYMTSFTIKDGLISNNILFILIDKNGLVYLGTDAGLMVYSDGCLVCYK